MLVACRTLVLRWLISGNNRSGSAVVHSGFDPAFEVFLDRIASLQLHYSYLIARGAADSIAHLVWVSADCGSELQQSQAVKKERKILLLFGSSE